MRFDLPKIANVKALMPEVYRDKPVLVSQGGAGSNAWVWTQAPG
jgi:hypothetical protein